MKYTISKSIEFDYGHRVHSHGSKCRNIHGHRGKVEATCLANELQSSGEQSDMVLDFGFLKQIMMDQIHDCVDHGFILCIEDEILLRNFIIDEILLRNFIIDGSYIGTIKNLINESIKEFGYWLSTENTCRINFKTIDDTKLYVVPFIPTAERLAEHFFNKIKDLVEEKSNGIAKLTNIRFWETPTSYSDFG